MNPYSLLACGLLHMLKENTSWRRKTEIKITIWAAEIIKVGKQMQKKGNL